MLALVALAAAHSDPTPHVHTPDPMGLVVLAAWGLAAVALWRKLA